MLEFLDELQDEAAASTAYLPPGLSAQEIGAVLPKGVPEELSALVARSETGGVLLWGSLRKYLIEPPFPIEQKATAFNGFVIGPLQDLLGANYTIGLVLVHLGAYAVGLCRGEQLVTSKVGTGLVHGRHKKGGSSQGRFQRRREKQATEFLDRVCLHAREHLEPEAGSIDYLVYGGPRQTILQLQKRCPFLSSFEGRLLSPLDVPDPRREILEKAVGRVWSSCVTEWREEA
jgi:hypothetical protein